MRKTRIQRRAISTAGSAAGHRPRGGAVKRLACLWFISVTAEWADNAPKIEFDRTVYDFCTTSLVESVTGTFTFTNAGDDVLKLQAPKPSCGCTVARLSSDTL